MTSDTLAQPLPRPRVLADLVARARRRLDAATDTQLANWCEDAVWNERNRAERRGRPPEPDIDALAAAVLRGSRADRATAALTVLRRWSDEVHGHFDPRVHRMVTRFAPGAIDALLSSSNLRWRPDRPDHRLSVRGNTTWLAELAQEATLVVCPTHVSNLDSPLIGLALHQAGLPPFLYGAGLNLFSNPWLGWWMHRLGAYTVDRTKKSTLYLDLLKDYATRATARGQHGLFFPGGTRSRSGALETRTKRGLLGTAIAGWQESIAAGVDREVYVVPVTFSYPLVLEANTLIQDHLAEAGRQRFIIEDDESAAPRTVLSFVRRVFDLDATVVVHFGHPVDVAGRPVSTDAVERRADNLARRRLVSDREGRLQADPQRDRAYTDLVANALVDAWPRSAWATETSLAACCAIQMLGRRIGSTDPFRCLRATAADRRFPRAALTAAIAHARAELDASAARGMGHVDLPSEAPDLLATALLRFARWHRSRALAADGDDILIEDPRLAIYYAARAQPFLSA